VDAIIRVERISKYFKSGIGIIGKKTNVALDDVSVEVRKGEIFGLLGPNGAGKTTLMKIILGLTYPTKGHTEIMGKFKLFNSIKGQIGYLPENYSFPPDITGWQFLNYVGMMHSIAKKERYKKIDTIFHQLAMIPDAPKKIKSYSKGMKRKLGIAQAMLHSPEILFLDEPTEGLDPIGRKQIRDILKDLELQGKTIVLNSHLLSEIEIICHRVAILNKGSIVKLGAVSEITEVLEGYRISIPHTAYKKYKSIFQNYTVTNGTHYLYIDVDSSKSLDSLVDRLRKHEIHIETIERRRSSLEDYFIQITGEDNKS